METLLTVEEVLDILGGVPRSTWDKWRATGQAPRVVKLPSGKLRIAPADLEAWLNELAEAA
jgi:predicted DNA-binding transcriptional regulator AlpA